MVTFVCNICDSTLKKKQCDGHIKGRCRPGSLICIDCHKTFQGDQFKNHVSCLTQQEKHWGQYAKPKHITTKAQIPISKPQSIQNNHKKNDCQKKEIIQIEQKHSHKIKREKQEIQNNHVQNDWKGWKNQIKSLIKQYQDKVNIDVIKQKTFKRYRSTMNQQPDQQIFQDRLRKIKKIKMETYVWIQ